MLERDTRILTRFAQHTARHGGPAAALSPSGRVLAATPARWMSGHVDVPADRDEQLLGEGTAAVVAHPLGEGTLLVPAKAARRRPRASPTRLTLLGSDRAKLATHGTTRRLTARHSEIVALLALHPDGLGARELAQLLYGERGHEVSVRAELHRLRAVLGSALDTRPYRLVDSDVDVDLVTVQGLLERGATAEARRRCGGALLPGSPVPAIVRAREALAARLQAGRATR
jgi:hypothetical protein